MRILDHEPIVKAANALGPLPQVALRLSEILAKSDYATKDVVDAIELDSTLAGRVLRLANSALYSGGPVSSVSAAVTRLGTGTIRVMAIAAKARPKLEADLSFFGLTPESYWKHCVTVLSFAEELILRKRLLFSDDFTTAAILHDYGKLLLCNHITDAHIEQFRFQDPALPASEKETRVLGVNHGEVTAVVAQSWKLSDGLIRAVQHHHNPIKCDTPICYGLNLANHLAWRLEMQDEDYERGSPSRFDSMTSLGIDDDELQSIFDSGAARLAETLDVYQ